MNIKTFLKDRIGYAIAYFISNFIVILVMYLTLIINNKEFPKDNVLYAFIVSIILFTVFLIYDYYRNKVFYKQLNIISTAKEDLESILNIDNPINNEQRLFKDVFKNIYRIHGNKISKYEEAHKQYIYFINQWVHQMKTPVSVINLTLEDQTDGHCIEVFESIREENEKISHGLEMMLYNARLNEFNLDFNVESIEVDSIVRKVINDNKKSLIKHSIFPKVISDNDIEVETDKKWISFVINQIVLNAIKYSKDIARDKKSITFRIQDEEARISLYIEDEGIGIPKEDLGRVFQPFFTGKNGRKTAESTGMGMYLSKRICDELGHDLIVESKEGKGTKFAIIFYKGKNIFNLSKL